MEKLTTKKKLAVVRQYLSGMSYDEIAAKSGISKGTVANIVAELKGGGFPEAADAAEQIELLRELSLDLKHSGQSPSTILNASCPQVEHLTPPESTQSFSVALRRILTPPEIILRFGSTSLRTLRRFFFLIGISLAILLQLMETL